MLKNKYLAICASNEECFLVYSDDIRPAIGDLVVFDNGPRHIYARVIMWWLGDEDQTNRIKSAWNYETEDTAYQIKDAYAMLE